MANSNVQQDTEDLEDDRPIAVRRKRRISTLSASSVDGCSVQKTEETTQQPTVTAKTPIKAKKRVRFSDPNSEPSQSSPATGLTPYLKQASFDSGRQSPTPSSPRVRMIAPRRLSLPAQLSKSLPSPSLSPSPGPLSGEIQFEPLRQVLDARTKRRVRRHGLSEELNDILAVRKEKTKWKQEIQELKSQLACVKQAECKEHSEKESEDKQISDRVQELEHQIEDMREQARERSMTAEPTLANPGPDQPTSGEIDIFVDSTDDGVGSAQFNEGERSHNPETTGALTVLSEVATQTPSSTPVNTEMLREARLSFEYMFPGEITLGLVPDDPQPLLDAMLDRMRDLNARVILAETSLSTTQKQEANLRNQFNAVLAQLDRARKYAETIHTDSTNERSRADTSQARVQMLEGTIQAAASKVRHMEKDADEKDRSIQKLQDALETYRVEVGNLESLVTKMEGEHNAALANLRSEMDEAVADLECHVVAETRGRREAEREVAERDDKIKQLKNQEEELKNALNEKRQIIRETERIFEEERLGRAREVGGLNVHIGQLSTELSESTAKVLDAEERQRSLMRKLQEERDAGLKAVEAVQAELARCEQNAEGVKTSYVSDVQRRGNEVTQHQGLLTPISATRFKDVEGYVEVRRGKGKGKKRDSGIVILEEDEDTIMADGL